MTMPDLHSRLDLLSQELQNAETKLKRKGMLSVDHEVTAAELRARHKALSQKLQAEVTQTEARGHHVSDLERSLRTWLDSLEIEMD